MVNRFSDTISTVGMFGLTGKLIRRSIIKKNNIFFVNSMRNFEDETFMWDVIGVAKRIYYVKNQLMHITLMQEAIQLYQKVMRKVFQ